MSFLFPSSKGATIPKAPPSMETVRDLERQKLREGMPSKGTILTSPLGLTGQGNVQRKTLLGE